jgi:hypothetical protein
MRFRFFPAVWGVMLSLCLVHEVAAGEDAGTPTPPQFTYWQEIWLEHVFKPLERHKAYALGLGNYDYYTYDYETLAEARQDALNGCRDSVQEAFGKDVDTQCQLVMENDQFVWRGGMPKPMTENYLPEPDLPLARANVFGEIASGKTIVLALHACDGQGDPQDEWFKSWLDFFLDRGYAVISPSSFADKQDILCGDDIENVKFDPVIRLRVAQTLRTITNLKRLYPGMPIILWGQGMGGMVAQMVPFDVKGTIITGAPCYPASPKSKQPVLHVFGSEDSYALPADTELPLTPEKIKTACKNYGSKGAQRFVLVKSDDFWTPASDPQVTKALEEFLARLPE